MKKIYYIPLAFIMLCSCEKNLPAPDDGRGEQLIMNASLSSADSVHTVYFSLGTRERLSQADSITLFEFYVNDELAASSLSFAEEDRHFYRSYTFRARFGAGDRLRMVAGSGRHRAEAVVTVPQPAAVTGVDTSTVFYNGVKKSGTYTRLMVTVRDRPGEENYYRIRTYKDAVFEVMEYGDDDINVKNGRIQKEYEVYNQKEPLLNSGIGNATTPDDSGSESYFDNKYNVFSDRQFEDGEYTLDIMVDKDIRHVHPYEMMSYWNGGTVFRTWSSAVVRIQTLSEAEYMKLNCIQFDGSNESGTYFINAPVIPDNVEGGLGVVTASSYCDYVIRYPEEIQKY